MKNDLISRQAVFDILKQSGVWHDRIEAIEALPSADAVEVVRCKDCKHSHMTYDGLCKYCDMWDEDGEALYLEGDFFCAYGERRKDGEA